MAVVSSVHATADLEVYVVEMPRVAQLSASSTNAFGVVLTELVAPGPNRLVCHGHAALGHQLLDIAIADREPEIQPYAVADDFRGKTVAMVGRARAVYEPFHQNPRQLDRATRRAESRGMTDNETKMTSP